MARRKRHIIHDIETERVLVACVVHYAHKTFPIVRGIVQATDFADPRHAMAWRAVTELYDAKQAIDTHTVAAHATSKIDTPTAEYLLELRGDDFVIQNCRAYAERVAKCARIRATCADLHKLLDDADWSNAGADEWIAKVESFKARRDTTTTGVEFVSSDVVGVKVLDMLERREAPHRVRSPWPEVNRKLLGGFAAGLHIIAARPGGGKSIVAQQVAWKIAEEEGRVLFFSLEMGAEDIFRRMVAQHSGVDFGDILTSNLHPDDYWSVRESVNFLRRIPIDILFDGRTTIQRIVHDSELAHAKGGLAAIVVDHIGLVRWGDAERKFERRQEVVAEFAHELMALGNSLGIPVFAAVQMNRAIESRGGRVPVLSDLRECGDLEQDAYTVMFPITPLRSDPDQSTAQLIIAKHRNGPTAAIPMVYEGDRARLVEPLRYT